jgi:hypothetical protein
MTTLILIVLSFVAGFVAGRHNANSKKVAAVVNSANEAKSLFERIVSIFKK